MQITNEQLNKFIDIYQKRFGVVLDKQSAYEKGEKLINLMRIVYKPITKNDYEKYSKEIQQLSK